MTNLDSILKGRNYFANKDPYSQSYGSSSSHVWMWELDHKEGWEPKNWCFWTVVLGEDSWESLGLQGDQQVHPKGNQSWIFIGRTDGVAEAPILWPPNVRSQFILKDPGSGKDWRQEKQTTEDEMVGWHHRLNRHESEQAPGDGERQGSLACCSPWGRKKSYTTEWHNKFSSQNEIKSPHMWTHTRTLPKLVFFFFLVLFLRKACTYEILFSAIIPLRNVVSF